MTQEFRGRFILLDLCHPMRTDTIKTIIESLEKSLVLGLSLPLNGIQFGIFVLDSDCKIIHPQHDSRQSYNSMYKALRDLVFITKEHNKVTVQKYKEFMAQALDTIFREYFSKSKNSNCSKHLKAVSIEIAIITKKAASVLVEILTDILKKLPETNLMRAVKKFKIVQILNENEGIYKIEQKNDLIECTTCLDHSHYLAYFFKGWLLNPEDDLEIVINKHMNFILKCYVDNCALEPISSLFNRKIDPKIFQRNSSLDKLKPKSLEVISKIPISRFCPTFLFGNPRRIIAVRSKISAGVELQKNWQLFKALCLELQNTALGLLTRSRIQLDGHEIITFQFIISVGDILLMNDVAPDELYFQKEMKALKLDHVDEGAVSFVKICLDDIKILNEYYPRDFASGIHKYLNYLLRPSEEQKSFHLVNKYFNYDGKIGQDLQHHLTSTKMMKMTVANSDLINKTILKKSEEVFKCLLIKKRAGNSPLKLFNSNCDRKFLLGANTQNEIQDSDNKNCQLMKKLKFNPEEKFEETTTIHPALLPQDMVRKYRKINSKAFNLPELSQDFSKDLVHWY